MSTRQQLSQRPLHGAPVWRRAAHARLASLLTALAVAGLLAFCGAASPSTCKLTLALVDAESGAGIPGMVRITDAAGAATRAETLLSRGVGLPEDSAAAFWMVVPRELEVKLAFGRYRFVAISGLETEAAQAEIDLTGRAACRLELPLQRFWNAREEGLRSGNTHLHLMKISRETCDRYLAEVPLADQLDLVFLSYLERAGDDAQYTSNRYTVDDLARLERTSGVLFANGEEHRHNFAGYGEGFGHVMFLNLSRLVLPVSIGPGIMKSGDDGLPLARGIETARQDGAAVIWCHNEWGLEAAANWVAGRVDAQNIFDGGIRSSFKDSFYRYLNAGLRIPFSTGTDWFMYDFSRVYARVDGELTAKNWLRALARGQSFITNGPMLSLKAGGAGPGQTVSLERPGTIEVAGRAAGRIDFEKLELVRNGRVVAVAGTRNVAGHYEAELRLELPVESPCWLALRTPPPSVKEDPELQQSRPTNELGNELFAHTSAIDVELAGRRLFDVEAARQLLARIQAEKEQAARRGQFPDELAKARVLEVYDQAVERLLRRIDAAR
jgi:hypothetical protein